ncbi:MAG: hypothetical protein ACOZCP_10100 [Pseudomonadota bacterium]
MSRYATVLIAASLAALAMPCVAAEPSPPAGAPARKATQPRPPTVQLSREMVVVALLAALKHAASQRQERRTAPPPSLDQSKQQPAVATAASPARPKPAVREPQRKFEPAVRVALAADTATGQ